MTAKLTIADYPLAETRSDKIRGQRGKSLDDITLAAVMAGKVTMEDLRITPQALADQAETSAPPIARRLPSILNALLSLWACPRISS